MNAPNFDQYGLLSHPVANASHHHQTGQHHHHQQQQQQQQSHHQGNFGMSHSGNQADDMFIARQNLFDSVSRLSVQMRHAAEMCDAFVKAVARQNPQVAALMLAQPTSVTSGNPAASASGSGVPASFDFLNIANGGNAGSVSGASADASAVASNTATGSASNGKKAATKPLTKAEKRREKRLRDPDAPKRPPSAYLLFQNEVREEVRKKHPGMPYSEVLGKVSEAWKALTEEQRKIYQDKTVENMAQWSQQKKDHEANMSTTAMSD